MRVLILFLAILIIGLLVGPMLIENQSSVVIALDRWVIEMSMVSLAVILLLSSGAILALAWISIRIIRILSGSQKWFSGWSDRKHNKAFTQGLVALDEANYSEAEKQLSHVGDGKFSGVELLAAAQAANNLGHSDKAVTLWERAQNERASKLAATIHLIEHHIKQRNPGEAISQIKQLSEKEQKNKRIVLLWVQALAESGQWQQLRDNLSSWKKQLSVEDYQYWMKQTAQGFYAELASKEGANPLKQYWQSLPRKTRNDPAQQSAYVEQLIGQGMHKDAEEALLNFQSKQPQKLLFPLFRELHLTNPTSTIKCLENWLKKDSENAELLSVLGQVAFNAKDWDLAERALAKAIRLASDNKDVLLLARVKEQQQEPSQALELYKQSLQI
ncbi:heme biosynthesis protein HemY [Alteromonadaceae bacterium M269]|nr:heme biosynthesis protein HemY [Alteromonadaceae bacterium M269]